jgi:hypothetical protein
MNRRVAVEALRRVKEAQDRSSTYNEYVYQSCVDAALSLIGELPPA